MKYSLVLSTVPNSKLIIKKIVDGLLRKKVCACINVLPHIESHYWWKRKIESSKEALLLIKTTRSKADAVTRALKALHPYEVPEIISLDIQSGWLPYLDWIKHNVK